MSSKTLCYLVRAAVIAVAVCGLGGCVLLLPAASAGIALQNPQLAYMRLPWLVFLWMTVAPCFAILFYMWRIAYAIKIEQVFTQRTADWVKKSALILFADICFFFTGNIVLLFLNMNHPGILLISLCIDVFGFALAILAAVLSRYITKAAVLQEEADATV